MNYPGYNRKWKKGGRILRLEVLGPHLHLTIGSESFQIKYHPEHEKLKINDWVIWDENHNLKVVAPSIREPSFPKAQHETLKKWSQYLKQVRHFFDRQDFLELNTPSLVPCPGTEPTLDVFVTELKVGSQARKVFLPTSPELHLKKALAQGFDRIYEIAKCYRNNEVTPLHQPEFWMLEWYRSFANLTDIQSDVVNLVFSLCDFAKMPRPQIQCFTIRQLFKKHLNYDLKPQVTREELQQLCAQQDFQIRDHYTIDDLFFILMLEKIEPEIPRDALVFVEKYPPFQAALARRDHEGWAERFEVFWKGMEIANAFDELNDPVEQRARSQEDLLKREGRTPIALDEEFLLALESGMPPSAGIALGLERLFMALEGIESLEKLRLFPVR
jgi:lysyl-tRNA synthetase class 2